ncbi:MAG: lysophospholipid acyltransferase family protein [Desulfobacteraceae bacterium]|nr:lysophospholipid acyltransferase family protein [Desulfobacteraceae bacterium]
MIDSVMYKLFRSLLLILGMLPYSIQNCAATWLGRIFFRLDKKHRKIAASNLTLAFGNEKTPRQIYELAQKVFENLCRIIFEIGWSLSLTERQFHNYFRLHNVCAYRQAITKGRGALILVAHFGNWELLPIVAHMAAMPVRIVYRPMDAPFVDRFFKKNRSRFGGVPIPTRKGAMHKIYKALRKGNPVGLLMDQNVDWYDGVFVDFFNRRACTNTGMAVLALKSRAPVVPLFLIRKGRKFDAVFGPELPLIQTGDKIKDIEENTRQYNRVIENYARNYPDQWFWVHQRWKTRPMCPWPDPARKDRYYRRQQKNK